MASESGADESLDDWSLGIGNNAHRWGRLVLPFI